MTRLLAVQVYSRTVRELPDNTPDRYSLETLAVRILVLKLEPKPIRSETGNPRWKGFYISKHIEMAGKAALVTSFVERASAYESIEVGNYLKAIELLNSLHFGFKDVQIFLLKPQINVLLNLVGLHYCINWLNVPAEYVIEAVNSSRVSERQVCVQWWKLGRWFYGFRLRDELHSRNVALGDLTACDEEVIGVLHRGAIHEVIRVRISAATTTHTSWLYQVAQA
ncbi:hypothetical protein OROMI_005882 [Orobanche minor]